MARTPFGAKPGPKGKPPARPVERPRAGPAARGRPQDDGDQRRAPEAPKVRAEAGVLVVNGYSERWLRQGFSWVYPAEVLGGVAAAGAEVRLRSAAGEDLGVAIADDGWIRARRFRTTAAAGAVRGSIDAALLRGRLDNALKLRQALNLGNAASTTTAWRWINGENDDLPGIRVDVWGDHVVVSLDSPSLVGLLPALLSALRAALPAVQSVHVGWRPDSRDGRVWPAAPGCVYGEAPGVVVVRERGLEYLVEPAARKDVGLFPDQRENRTWLEPFYPQTRVLNLFCYTGAFSVHALASGAAEVVSVDLSKPYLDRLDENLRANGLGAPDADGGARSGTHERIEDDALKVLDRFRRQGRVFDRIILDPPGHSHSDAGDWSGEQDYARLVAAAARVTSPGGWIVASSNLGSVSPRQFQGAIVDGLRKASCHGRVLHTGGQAADFPAALHFPEGSFLKFVVMEVQRAE